MKQPSHIIEIDSIVLDGVDLRNPRALRGLVERETRRVLVRSGLTASSVLAGTEAGSKLDKALDLGVPVLDWDAFQKLVNG